MLQQPAGYFVDVAQPGYRLAAAGREAAEDERLGLLEQIYDPLSRRRRILVRPGWRCLEVGGGRGSMAAWLAEKVGPTGHVVATDIDLGYLRRLELPNLEAVEHNILEDPLEPLGSGSFDLVCSRLTLFHLVGRQELAIGQMVKCLRPGGWLIDEDADWGTAAPVDPSHPLYAGYHDVWRDGGWWTVRGYDKVFGRKLPALFERCGLKDIRHDAATEVVRGGSPWARWWAVTLEGLGPEGAAACVLGQASPRRRIASASRDLSHTPTLVVPGSAPILRGKIQFAPVSTRRSQTQPRRAQGSISQIRHRAPVGCARREGDLRTLDDCVERR